jgi:hypothetical protein
MELSRDLPNLWTVLHQFPIKSLQILSNQLYYFPLQIKAMSLTPGQQYTFHLITTGSGSGSSSPSLDLFQITILINEPPSNGQFLITPLTGYAYEKIYDLCLRDLYLCQARS